MPYTTARETDMNGHYATDSRDPQKRKGEGKAPDVEEAPNEWFSTVTV
jgi:hypothetical protein